MRLAHSGAALRERDTVGPNCKMREKVQAEIDEKEGRWEEEENTSFALLVLWYQCKH